MLLEVFLVYFLFIIFFHSFSLCTPGPNRTQYIDQSGLKLFIVNLLPKHIEQGIVTFEKYTMSHLKASSLDIDFPAEILMAKMELNEMLQVLKENDFQTELSYTRRVSLWKREVKTLKTSINSGIHGIHQH